VSDELNPAEVDEYGLPPVEHLVVLATRCAHCDGPLPAPIERLAVVHGRDGELMTTCSTTCLAELVADLAGRPRQPVAGRLN
jgi:hypothetical protein